jgi:hypothetical protein
VQDSPYFDFVRLNFVSEKNIIFAQGLFGGVFSNSFTTLKTLAFLIILLLDLAVNVKVP